VGESDPAIADLEARVAKMRALGVTRWGDIELGPAPQGEAKTQTQQKSPAQLEEERRKAQRSIALGAAGALVPRLGQDRIE
jgi:hypothetical protein